MTVDKEFEIWDKLEPTFEEKAFANKYRGQGKDLNMIGAFYGGYHARQKTLSPEVRDMLEWVLSAICERCFIKRSGWIHKGFGIGIKWGYWAVFYAIYWKRRRE